jgi:hypothetical protein
MSSFGFIRLPSAPHIDTTPQPALLPFLLSQRDAVWLFITHNLPLDPRSGRQVHCAHMSSHCAPLISARPRTHTYITIRPALA